MPTYEYKCTQEGNKFDLWQEVGAPAPPCPTCGAPSKKVFAPPRVIFKGSGFYVTDLRAEKSGGQSEGDGGSASKSAGQDTKNETSAAPAASKSEPSAPASNANGSASGSTNGSGA